MYTLSLHVVCLVLLSSDSHGDVLLLDDVEAGQHSGPSDTSQNVGAGALEKRQHSLVLNHLHGTVNRAVVFDSLSTGHHHPPSDSVNGVGSQTSRHGHSVSEQESEEEPCVVAEHRNDAVVDAEVETSVYEDANT